MRHTLGQIFHSGKFIIGFVIFFTLLLTTVIYPLIIPDKPRSSKQQYRTTEAGRQILETKNQE